MSKDYLDIGGMIKDFEKAEDYLNTPEGLALYEFLTSFHESVEKFYSPFILANCCTQDEGMDWFKVLIAVRKNGSLTMNEKEAVYRNANHVVRVENPLVDASSDKYFIVSNRWFSVSKKDPS